MLAKTTQLSVYNLYIHYYYSLTFKKIIDNNSCITNRHYSLHYSGWSYINTFTGHNVILHRLHYITEKCPVKGINIMQSIDSQPAKIQAFTWISHNQSACQSTIKLLEDTVYNIQWIFRCLSLFTGFFLGRRRLLINFQQVIRRKIVAKWIRRLKLESTFKEIKKVNGWQEKISTLIYIEIVLLAGHHR